MNPPADAAPNLCGFGAGVLLTHLGALEKEMEGVRSGGADIEHIHRMRVATRRLRAALPLFATCLPRKKSGGWFNEIRLITRALGSARDADVQIEHLEQYYRRLSDGKQKPGIARLLLRLRQHRQQLQPGVVKALDRFSNSQTLPLMRAALEPHAARQAGPPYPDQLYRHASDSLRPRLDEFLAYDAIVALPERVTELHEMRIAAKRLRYTLETFGPLFANGLKSWLTAIREAQETLGNIHDCDVWGDYLPRFMAEEEQRVLDFYGARQPYLRLLPGIQGYLDERKAERHKLYGGFVPQWQKWQRKLFWQSLGETIQAPLLDARQIYPPPASPLPQREDASER